MEEGKRRMVPASFLNIFAAFSFKTSFLSLPLLVISIHKRGFILAIISNSDSHQ